MYEAGQKVYFLYTFKYPKNKIWPASYICETFQRSGLIAEKGAFASFSKWPGRTVFTKKSSPNDQGVQFFQTRNLEGATHLKPNEKNNKFFYFLKKVATISKTLSADEKKWIHF